MAIQYSILDLVQTNPTPLHRLFPTAASMVLYYTALFCLRGQGEFARFNGGTRLRDYFIDSYVIPVSKSIGRFRCLTANLVRQLSSHPLRTPLFSLGLTGGDTYAADCAGKPESR